MPADLTVSLKEYFEALLDAERRFMEERNQRYAEVNTEREKALKIKEVADLKALDLARDIQVYKDEKANQLREQINSERGLYATNKDLEPLKAFIQGAGAVTAQNAKYVAIIVAVASIVNVIIVGAGVTIARMH